MCPAISMDVAYVKFKKVALNTSYLLAQLNQVFHILAK